MSAASGVRGRLGWRRLFGSALLLALSWALGGRLGLALGIGTVASVLLFEPPARLLVVAAALEFAAVPFAMLSHGLPANGTIGSDLPLANQAANGLAASGLLLLVVGVVRDVRADAPEEAPGGE